MTPAKGRHGVRFARFECRGHGMFIETNAILIREPIVASYKHRAATRLRQAKA